MKALSVEAWLRIVILIAAWAIGSVVEFGRHWRHLDPFADILVAYAITTVLGLVIGGIILAAQSVFVAERPNAQFRRVPPSGALCTGLTIASLPCLWFAPRIY